MSNSRTAIQETIFNNFITNRQHEFCNPTLQNEAVEIISSKITDAIYGNLKKKNVASTKDHLDLLTFINCCCQTNYLHSSKDAQKIYLNAFKKQFPSCNNTEVESILHGCCSALRNMEDFENNLKQFYNMKHNKQKIEIIKYNFIKEQDKQRSRSMSDIEDVATLKSCTFYQTNEKILHEILGDTTLEVSAKDTETLDYRNKQIKFCYACLNVGAPNDLMIVKSILMKMLKYDKLEQFEIDFLIDLFLWKDKAVVDIQKCLTDNFVFVLEKIVILFASEIIQLDNDDKVNEFFTKLKTNKKIQRIREICEENSKISTRLKIFVLELYVNSYCNIHLNKLLEILNIQ